MYINDIINAKCATVDKVEVGQTVFQETEPYSISKTITGTNVYVWNKKFIDKVMESFSTTIVQNFSKKEKLLFDKYTNYLVNGVVDLTDKDVVALDTYIGTIKGDYL